MTYNNQFLNERGAELLTSLLYEDISGKADVQVVTQEEYDALDTSKLSSETLYIITSEISEANNAAIKVNTTAGWNSQSSLLSERNTLYVYSDYKQVDGYDVPNIKLGTGALLSTLPFAFADVTHEADSTIHITQDERDLWNSKVSCSVNETTETIVFA